MIALADEEFDRRIEARKDEIRSRKQAAQEYAILISRPLGFCKQSPLMGEFFPLIEPNYCVRIPNVNDEDHLFLHDRIRQSH